MTVLKKLFCKHSYKMYGWTYVKCSSCGRVKRNKKLATKLILAFLKEREARMKEAGFTNLEITQAAGPPLMALRE